MMGIPDERYRIVTKFLQRRHRRHGGADGAFPVESGLLFQSTTTMPNIRTFQYCRLLRPLLLILLIGLLASCATAPRPRGEDPLAQQADRLAQAGQYRAAAELYLAEAATTQGLDRIRLRLQAAGYLLDGNDADAAAVLVQDIDTAGLPAEEQTATALVEARIALARHRPDAALSALRAAPAAEDSPLAPAYHRLRAQAYDMAGNRLESARERVWLDGLLTEPAAREENQRAIWESLSGLSDTALQRLRLNPPPDILSGWMELVQVARSLRRPGASTGTALQDWRMRYPSHPVDPALLDQLLGQTGPGSAPLQRIGVLLPITGSLATPAAAIRDGILAARFRQAAQGEAPEIRFYDTGAGPQSVWTQYQLAIADGAQMVIGPLRKESVQSLAQSGTLDIPVLALNQTETGTHPSLYQFGLAPEDEAQQVAERARWDGHSGAVVLIPEGAWAERVYNAFASRWTELGGSILEVQRFPANQVDFGTAIQSLLNLDDSRNRARALTRQLGRSLEFEPRRRQDADFVFLLARPQEARQIKPQLRFHHASDLPVYTTSYGYAGHVDENRDQDMNGIRFCDMPWVLAPEEAQPSLHTELARLWPADLKRNTRLYALGIDAYQLLPFLQQPGLRYLNGVTGVLSVDHGQKIYRELRWAEMQRGHPRLLEAALELTPAPLLPDDLAPMEGPMEAVPAPEDMDEPTTDGSPGGTDRLPTP